MANAQNGNFVWYENLTKDVKGSIAFYTEVVGWKTQPFDDSGNYTMWVSSQGPIGGVMTLPEQAAKMGVPPHWMGHVQVASVDETASQVKKLGGKVHKDPEDIPNVGRFAVIADPQGASLSVFTPKQPMTLHDMTKPGEMCWNELLTTDAKAGLEFYTKVFGWKVLQEMDMGPMGTYRIFGVGEQRVGGAMTVPKGAPMPTAWLYYVDVGDLDGAIARATTRGAKVMNGPMDIPEGARIAQLTDPLGAAFALHQQPKKK
ncbi:MAG TPA: VOC family protein [Labilithrix sp.]